MEVTQPTTPAAPVEPGQTDTPPPAEPVAPPAAPESAPDQSAAVADRNLAQAEYTRSQQAFAELKRELGLEGKVTREQILDALRSRLAGGTDEEPAEQMSERERELAERAFAAELRVQEAVYSPIFGEKFGKRTLDFVNTVRQTNDPEEIFAAAVAYLEAHRPAEPAESAPPAEPGAPAAPPADIGLPEGDQAPSVRTSPSAGGRRESGVVGAIRGIFREQGVTGPAPQR